MHKVIALITRKPGSSKAEFISYYESNHAPLAKRTFSQFLQYRRNFVDLTGAIISPGVAAPDFDSVTELWFKDKKAVAEMLSTHFSTAHQTIDEDERKFLDQSKTLFFNVDEHGARHANAELGPDRGHFKVIALLTVKPGLSRAELVDYYETRHAPLIWSKFPWIVEYRRNFIDTKDAIMAPAAPPLDFDVVTELWFADRAGYDKMLSAHADPEVGGAVARDEENCFDRTKTRFFAVEEHGGPIAGR